MRKRLFDGLDQGLGEEVLLLPDLPAPGGHGTYCSLCWALARVLSLAGQPASTEWLMGLTGMAFMLSLGDHLQPDWDRPDAAPSLPAGFTVLGSAPTDATEPGEAAVLSRCREQLRLGRALAAQQPEGTWVVAVGLHGEALLVQAPGSPRLYERQALPVRSVIGLGDLEPATLEMEAGLEALDRARELLDSHQAHWGTWADALSQHEPYGPEPERLERFLDEQLLVATVMEAREAAAGFLAELSAQADFELAEALDAAAGAAERVVLALEQLVESPEALGAARVAEDAAWLERRREAIRRAQDNDARLGAALNAAVDSAGLFR